LVTRASHFIEACPTASVFVGGELDGAFPLSIDGTFEEIIIDNGFDDMAVGSNGGDE